MRESDTQETHNAYVKDCLEFMQSWKGRKADNK